MQRRQCLRKYGQFMAVCVVVGYDYYIIVQQFERNFKFYCMMLALLRILALIQSAFAIQQSVLRKLLFKDYDKLVGPDDRVDLTLILDYFSLDLNPDSQVGQFYFSCFTRDSWLACSRCWLPMASWPWNGMTQGWSRQTVTPKWPSRLEYSTEIPCKLSKEICFRCQALRSGFQSFIQKPPWGNSSFCTLQSSGLSPSYQTVEW